MARKRLGLLGCLQAYADPLGMAGRQMPSLQAGWAACPHSFWLKINARL